MVSRRGGVARRLLAIWNSRGDRGTGLCCSCQDLFKSACAHRRSALVRWQQNRGMARVREAGDQGCSGSLAGSGRYLQAGDLAAEVVDKD